MRGGRTKKLVLYLGLLVALLSGVYLVPNVNMARAKDEVLPAKLQIIGVAAEGNDTSFFDYWSFRREFCGAAVFYLSPDTLDRVKTDGRAFLADALQARGFPDNHYYRYGGWKETPAPKEWFGDGIVATALHCASVDPALWKRLQQGSLRSGGFYTTKDEGQLILLPEEGIVIYTYYG